MRPALHPLAGRARRSADFLPAAGWRLQSSRHDTPFSPGRRTQTATHLTVSHESDPMPLALHVIEVGLDAADADLVEQMRHMAERRRAGFKHVGCLVRGYEGDPRALYLIPEVVEFCKKLVRIGFIAGLDVSFTVPERVPLPVPFEPWGSLDVWVVAKGYMKHGTVEVTRELLDEFTRDLRYANTVAEDVLSG